MKNLLIIGGSGQLGRTVLHTFKTKTPNWNAYNIDFKENKEAVANYKLDDKWKSNPDLVSIIQKKFNNLNFDCIVNVAGGFQMEGLSSKRVIISTEEMMNMNLYSSILASHMATQYLNKKSLLILTGAFYIYEKNNPSK